jgi:hypothetical protein
MDKRIMATKHQTVQHNKTGKKKTKRPSSAPHDKEARDIVVFQAAGTGRVIKYSPVRSQLGRKRIREAVRAVVAQR